MQTLVFTLQLQRLGGPEATNTNGSHIRSQEAIHLIFLF